MISYERYCYQLAYRYCFDVPTKEEYRRKYGPNVEEKREPVPIIKNYLPDVTKKVNVKKSKVVETIRKKRRLSEMSLSA